ncbi:MAG TPA: transporter substrate-binding domain-containing protein [Aliiroseovarius sp.]|nr:transporter substrate-binding domain-containing protein [Aliiroseovarius sp.]
MIGRARISLIVAAVLALLTPPALAQTGTVRLGTEGAYAPYTFLRDGRLVGFDIDLGDAICRRAELSCEWVIHDWDTIIDGLLNDQYDAIMAGMANTAERRRLVSFSIGYEPGNSAAVYVGKHPEIRLETAVIAVQGNTIQENHIRNLDLNVALFATMQDAIDAVRDGRADLVFGAEALLENAVFTSKGALTVVAREIVDAGAASIAFRKSDRKLRELFDTIIEDMQADGSLQELRQKWFSVKKDT